eukprot:SAG31_NODE_3163_length_4605_cov_15.046383_4_plen_54_part_00
MTRGWVMIDGRCILNLVRPTSHGNKNGNSPDCVVVVVVVVVVVFGLEESIRGR